jgi:hypothetical protein
MCQYSERKVAGAEAGDIILLSVSTFQEIAVIPYSDK